MRHFLKGRRESVREREGGRENRNRLKSRLLQIAHTSLTAEKHCARIPPYLPHLPSYFPPPPPNPARFGRRPLSAPSSLPPPPPFPLPSCATCDPPLPPERDRPPSPLSPLLCTPASPPAGEFQSLGGDISFRSFRAAMTVCSEQQHASVYVSLRHHMSAYVLHTSGDSIFRLVRAANRLVSATMPCCSCCSAA